MYVYKEASSFLTYYIPIIDLMFHVLKSSKLSEYATAFYTAEIWYIYISCVRFLKIILYMYIKAIQIYIYCSECAYLLTNLYVHSVYT